eukprot:3319373-Amphidinium_carterae.1
MEWGTSAYAQLHLHFPNFHALFFRNVPSGRQQVHMSFLLPNLLIFGLWQVLLSVGWMLATVSTGAPKSHPDHIASHCFCLPAGAE